MMICWFFWAEYEAVFREYGALMRICEIESTSVHTLREPCRETRILKSQLYSRRI